MGGRDGLGRGEVGIERGDGIGRWGWGWGWLGSGVGIVVTELLYQLEDPLKGQSTECVETE